MAEDLILLEGMTFYGRHGTLPAERELGQPFRDVAICGGHRYVWVASSWLADFRVMRQVAADAPVAIINGPIGVMRARLRAWMTR